MKNGQHYDVPIPLTEIDTVGESPCDGLAHIAIQNRELFRVTGNAMD